jgi:hypothetical protein
MNITINRPVAASMQLGRARSSAGLGRPALVWLAFSLLYWSFGPYSNYSGEGFLDPWIPTGYFLDFKEMVERSGFLYYVSRLPYILVGLILYSIFVPHVANFALNVLFLWLACLGLYSATERPFGRAPAVIATVAFAFSTYTANAMAWDYPDGPSIAYLLLGFWLVLAAPSRLSGPPQWFFVGIFWAMAGATNLIAGLVIIPGCVLVIFLAGLRPHEWLLRGTFIVLGVLVTLAVFSVISKVIFNQFWFLGPQISLTLHYLEVPGRLAHMWGTGYSWLLNAGRDAGLLAIAVCSIIALVMTAREPADSILVSARALIGLNLFSLFLFGIVEFVLHGIVLRVFYTSSYLVAPAYLALAATLSLLMRGWSSSWRAFSTAIAAILAFGIPNFPSLIAAWMHGSWLYIWALQAVPAVFMLCVALRPPAALRRSAALAAVLSSVALPNAAMTLDPALAYVFNFSANAATYDAALKVSDILRSGVANGRAMRFWFDLDEPFTNKFHSIAVLHLGWGVDLSRELPRMSAIAIKSYLPAGTLLVHLTSDPSKLNEREAQMVARGIAFGPRHDILIRVSPQVAFTLVLQDIDVTNVR